jgi:hypothetical protein
VDDIVAVLLQRAGKVRLVRAQQMSKVPVSSNVRIPSGQQAAARGAAEDALCGAIGKSSALGSKGVGPWSACCTVAIAAKRRGPHLVRIKENEIHIPRKGTTLLKVN